MRRSRRMTKHQKAWPKDVEALRRTPIRKDMINMYVYSRLVKRVMGHLDDEFYNYYLSDEVMHRVSDYSDTAWKRDRATIERIKLRELTKPKPKRVPRPQNANGIRLHRRVRQRLGEKVQPSMKLGNNILTKFDQLIQKSFKQCSISFSTSKSAYGEHSIMYQRFCNYYTNFVWTYYDMWGVSKNLINSLIRRRCTYFLEFLWTITSDKLDFVNMIDIRLLNEDSYRELIDVGIDLDLRIKFLLAYGDEQRVLDKIENYPKSEIMPNIDRNRFDSLIPKLIELKILGSDKKSIDTYIMACHFDILIRLIRQGTIRLTQAQIRKIFAKPSTAKRRRYYFWRRTQYNQKLHRKTNIFELLDAMIKRNITIPYSKALREYIISKGDLNMVKILLESKNIQGYVYNKSMDKLKEGNWSRFTRNVIDKDNLYDLRCIINLGLVSICDLHQNMDYLAYAIRDGSTKCATYMALNLRVKICGYNTQTIWGWSSLRRHADASIVRSIELMMNLNIPIIESIFTKALIHKKTKTIEYLIENCGFKLGANHMRYIKEMDIANFNKYVGMIDIDKIKLVTSMARGYKPHRFIWAFKGNKAKQSKKNMIVMNIISTQSSDKKKYIAKKVSMIALANYNSGLYRQLKARYKFDLDIKDVRSIISRTNYACGKQEFVNSIKTASPDLFIKMKEFSNEDKIRIVTNNIRADDINDDIVDAIKGLRIVVNLDLIKTIYEKLLKGDGDRWWWNANDGLNSKKVPILAKLIRLAPEYKDTESDTFNEYMKYVISKGGYNVMNLLCTKTRNHYQLFDRKDIYESCMSCITQQYQSTRALGILDRWVSDTNELTPAIWTVMRLSIIYVINQNRWYIQNARMTAIRFNHLIRLEPRMTQDDYDYFDIARIKKVNTKNIQIVEYDIQDDEKPDNYDFYLRDYLNTIAREENNMGTDEMELALQQAEKEIIDELGNDVGDELGDELGDDVGDGSGDDVDDGSDNNSDLGSIDGPYQGEIGNLINHIIARGI